MDLRPSQLKAIVSLLSSPDREIVAKVRKNLFGMGELTVREILRETKPRTQAAREVEQVLDCLLKPSLEKKFQSLSLDAKGDIKLEESAFLLAKLGHPDLQISIYKSFLDQIAFELAPKISPTDHPVHIIRTLNYVLFQKNGFRGQKNYITDPDPDNSYLNRVLDRKTGLPIALSVIYILLGRRLELPIVGINMPLHFIVKFSGTVSGDILIDPFNFGQILTINECRNQISAQINKKVSKTEIIKESTNRTIVQRMMINLFYTYRSLGDKKKMQTIENLIRIIHQE